MMPCYGERGRPAVTAEKRSGAGGPEEVRTMSAGICVVSTTLFSKQDRHYLVLVDIAYAGR